MATPSTPASIQRLISSRHGAALETVLLARLGTGVRHLANDFGGFRCDSAVNIVVFLVLSLRNTAGTVIQGASSRSQNMAMEKLVFYPSSMVDP